MGSGKLGSELEATAISHLEKVLFIDKNECKFSRLMMKELKN